MPAGLLPITPRIGGPEEPAPRLRGGRVWRTRAGEVKSRYRERDGGDGTSDDRERWV